MGIEIDSKYGGAGSTFFASIVAIEELARVDASVSVVCDVQNTLVNEYFRRYASKELQEKYFPKLAKDLVRSIVCICIFLQVDRPSVIPGSPQPFFYIN